MMMHAGEKRAKKQSNVCSSVINMSWDDSGIAQCVMLGYATHFSRLVGSLERDEGAVGEF